MTKEEILHYFQDINYMYNDCGMKDTLSKCLDEYAEEIREDAIAFFKSLIIKNDEDYDKPTISMKFLNDYIEQMIVDGFGADKGAEE